MLRERKATFAFRSSVAGASALVAASLLASPMESWQRAAPQKPDTPSRGSAAAPAAKRSAIFEEAEGTGLDFHHFNGMAGDFFLPEITCGGGALLDYDNDGDLDVFLTQGQRLDPEPGDAGERKPAIIPPVDRPGDRIFRNDLQRGADGVQILRFTDVSEASGLAAKGYSCGAAAGDYDGDGLMDLYVTRLGPNRLLKNRGDGTFQDVTAASGVGDPRWAASASWTDFDADGRLDLFVANYVEWSREAEKVCRSPSGSRDYCGPSSYVPSPNRLFRNLGGGEFQDVSERSGIARIKGKSLGVVGADFNGDGHLDFYVTNDGEANHLWFQRPGGVFEESAMLTGTALNGAGRAEASMGVDTADLDDDGDEDLFLTHLVGETNTLFLNDGEGNFADATARAGLGAPSWPYTSWGAVFTDYDHDGVLDLAVSSGAVRTLEAAANAGEPFPFAQPNQLFRGLGSGAFTEVGDAAGSAFERAEVSRGLLVGDLDNDGDEDLLVVNNSGPARILIDRVGQDRQWIGLRLVGDAAGDAVRDQIGARVALIRPGKKPRWRRVRTDGGYASSRDPRVRFGLDEETRPQTVRVFWPSFLVEEWKDLPVGRYTILQEGQGKTVP